MIRGKFISSELEQLDADHIVEQVFSNKLYDISDISTEYDNQFYMDVLVYHEDEEKMIPVATGRMVLLSDKEIEITRIAVLKNYRHQGYGDVTVRMLVNQAFIKGFTKIRLLCPQEVITFFKKIGFCTENEVTLDNNNTYISMRYGYNELIKPCSSTN